MAGLTKTYSGDLTQTIAGKLWDAIRDRMDEKGENKPSKEVRQAARELKKDDPDATKVQDKSLRETVLKIFGPIDAKLVATESKVDNLSGKVSAVTAGLVDTQNLIINQNQILEDKFDTILQLLTGQNDIGRKEEENAKFKQLEFFDDLEEDLSGTRGISKGSASGKGNPLSKFLKGRIQEMTMGIANRALKAAWKSKALKRVRVPYKMLRKKVTKGISETVLNRFGKSPAAKRGLARILAQGSARMMPVASSVLAADDIERYRKKGDWLGMSLAAIDMVASGAEAGYAAGGLPGLIASGIANAAGWSLTAYEMFQLFTGKDPYDESGIINFERGNVSPLGPDPTSSISDILGVTKAVMDSSGFGQEYGTLVSDAGLTGFSPSSFNYTSDIGRVESASSIQPGSGMFSDWWPFKGKKEEEKGKIPVSPEDDPPKAEPVGWIERLKNAIPQKKEHDDRNIFQKTIDFINPMNWFNKWGKGQGGPDTKPNTQRPIVGRVGNTGNSTGPHVHIQRFPPPSNYEQDHITKDHPVIDHIFVGGKSLGDWDFTSPASPDRWGRPHYGPDFGGLGINNQPITFSDQITYDPRTLYQRSSGGEGNNILFEYNGEQFTIFHLNSGPEGDLAAPRKDVDLSSEKLSSPTDNHSVAKSAVVSGKSQDREIERKRLIRNFGVVVINNIIAEEQTQKALPTPTSSSGNFINAYNLAKHTV